MYLTTSSVTMETKISGPTLARCSICEQKMGDIGSREWGWAQGFVSHFPTCLCLCGNGCCTTEHSNTQLHPLSGPLWWWGWPSVQGGSLRIGHGPLGSGSWYHLSDPGVPGRASVGPSQHNYWWWRPQCWSHRWVWLFFQELLRVKLPESLFPGKWPLKIGERPKSWRQDRGMKAQCGLSHPQSRKSPWPVQWARSVNRRRVQAIV